jgi:hypothetical protein
MRNVLQSVAAGVTGGLMYAAALTPALALTFPPSFAPRQFPEQMVHYLRITIAPNACVPATLTCSVKVGAVPYNAFLVGGHFQVYTMATGNGVTAFTASLGTSSGSANIVSAQAILTAGNAGSLTLVTTGAGSSVTGNGLAQTGANGGFDIWLTLTATTGYPTAGLAMMSLEYLAPNDTNCAPVPLGTTAPGC